MLDEFAKHIKKHTQKHKKNTKITPYLQNLFKVVVKL